LPIENYATAAGAILFLVSAASPHFETLKYHTLKLITYMLNNASYFSLRKKAAVKWKLLSFLSQQLL